jgi:PAS domain S-box-containing protein
MLSPARPANERDRQRALDDMQILDTPMDEAFDGLVRVAALVTDSPIALISLIDHDRQWFKARHGLDSVELPRDVSFCGHVVADSQPMLVPDAHLDDRFADNPVVTGTPHVRFYAGVPLRTTDGFSLGTLCAIDHVPRTLTAAQIEALEILARQVVHLMEKSRLRLTALREAERFRALFDGMAEGVVVQATTGAITQNNAAASRILGLSGDEMRGVTSVDPRWRSVHEDGSPYPGETHPAMVTLRTGAPQRNAVMGVHKPDGTLTWISINSEPLLAPDGGAFEVLTTFHDISPIKAAYEQLSRHERLALTGTLVAGIGHEINSPLAQVMGNLELVTDELRLMSGVSPSARMREVMELMGEARVSADRIRLIVRGLRSLSREDFALQPVDVGAVVATALGMAQHELRLRARVLTQLDGVPPVIGDESRLTQVIVNLLVNAAQAFSTADPDHNRIDCGWRLLADGRVELSIRDNGPGIEPDVAKHIFDPFFTTKPVGVGTGLGLAVSRSIVHALGGELLVTSTVGVGATFHVLLPTAGDAPSDASTESAVAPGASGPRGRIVIVDDDAALLTTLARVLGRAHEVRTFTDPREALVALRSDPEVDVVFCDLMMPHLTGQAVLREIERTTPSLASRFVFMTGGVTRSSEREFLEATDYSVLDKPFPMRDLLTLAQQLVTARRMPPLA